MHCFRYPVFNGFRVLWNISAFKRARVMGFDALESSKPCTYNIHVKHIMHQRHNAIIMAKTKLPNFGCNCIRDFILGSFFKWRMSGCSWSQRDQQQQRQSKYNVITFIQPTVCFSAPPVIFVPVCLVGIGEGDFWV